jgi:hypothetical protein
MPASSLNPKNEKMEINYTVRMLGSWDNVSTMVIMLQALQCSILIPSRGMYSLLHSVHTGTGPHLAPLIQWASGILFMRHEAVQSPPSTAEVKNELSCNLLPLFALMASTGTTCVLL